MVNKKSVAPSDLYCFRLKDVPDDYVEAIKHELLDVWQLSMSYQEMSDRFTLLFDAIDYLKKDPVNLAKRYAGVYPWLGKTSITKMVPRTNIIPN